MKKNLNNSKLIAYSAAAGAALAVAPNAFGTIIHNTVDINFGDGYGDKYLTLEGSTAEFRFTNCSTTAYFSAYTNGNSAKILASGNNAKALANTQYVGSTTNIPAKLGMALFSYNGTDGDWTQVGENKMLGMSFLFEGGSQGRVYGWIAVEKLAGGAGKITAWGYENDGTKIKVGAIPEPATGLALLALGAAGIAAYRRR